MDIDLDIPLPDELEWLEANSHIHEDSLYPDPPDPYPDEEEQEPVSPPSADPQISGQKRPPSEAPDSLDSDRPGTSGEKRSRINDVEAEIGDGEDWLRYSPPPERSDVVEEVRVEEEKIWSRYASEIDGDCVPVTAPSGDRVYAKICRVEREERVKKLDVRGESNGLISKPINVLLQGIEQEAFTKALQASSEGQSDIPETPVNNEQLWVDKYAPNSFTELLSDERTNREVLLWLKQWDSCVFGSEIRSTADEVLSALKRHSSISHHKKFSDTKFPSKNTFHGFREESFRHPDKLDHENSNSKFMPDSRSKKSGLTGQPEQKILLLCGPPGLGKTTLAHVAAKHCGYRVVEINASDDRSSSTVEARILDVVQMNSVMADSRPKCLVIDEIDGALGDGKGAVEVILKMVSAERKPGSGKENVAREEQPGKISSKKGRKTVSLSRPVICICNDLYAPALRTLRQVAKVHIFVQPTVNRVVSRLKYICNREGMKTSSIALTALAEYTECDIRSCLNTLQFLNKKKETLNGVEISSQVVGRKDMSKSVFDIWKEIFQKRKVKRERKLDNRCGSKATEFDFLNSLISTRGDYDLILDGIHENILHLCYHDPMMQKTVKCLNSLGVSDLLHQYVMHTHQMSIYAYQPSIAITVHHLVAQVQKPNIEWPKSYQRYRTTLMEKMEVLRSWHYTIPPYISRHLSTKSFVEDSVSSLLHILSPPTLRPAALHLLSEKEKNDLAQLVSTMVSYSITYKNMKSDPLSSNWRNEAALDAPALSLDPPICDLINFKDYRSDHYVLALAMKQVLVHEVEKQKILQVGAGRSGQLTDRSNKENQNLVGKETNRAYAESEITSAKKILNPRQGNPSTSTISSNLGSSISATTNVKIKSPGGAKKPSRGHINFFERFRKVSDKGSQNTDNDAQKAATLERDLRPLLFKFNEGFTNAVKRPVRIREFLQ